MYHTSSIGGGSYCLLNILKALDRKKYTPIVLLCENGPLVKAIEQLDIKIYYMPLMRLVPYNKSILSVSNIIKLLNLIRSFKQFRQILHEISPDIIYVNTMMMYPYLRIAKKFGAKTIIHIREHWPEEEHHYQRTYAIEQIKKHSDQIVAINKYSASMFAGCTNKVTIVYDWIDMSSRYEYLPYDTLLGEDVSKLKVYLYTGGLQKIKGAKEVLQAFTTEIKGDDRRLLVMGINPDIKRTGWRSRVKFSLSKLGYKTYSEIVYNLIKSDKRIICIPNTYNMSHIFQQAYCVVSYFTIPHANLALAECIIMKSLTLAASTPESIEYSKDGNLSELFEINNYVDFIDKWKRIDSNGSDKLEQIKKDSDKVSLLFNPQRNIELLSQVYGKL